MGDIAFKIGTEYLDLAPNTILDLEEENPFLQMGAEIKGQYSLPFSVPCTEMNMRLLGYPNLLQARKSKTGIDAILMVNGIQHSRGQIKIETTNNHINHPQRGTITLYYLFGISDFYKLIENKLLTDLNYGADYSFPRVSEKPNREDPSNFLGYITQVMRSGNPDTHDFAIFPVHNDGSFEDDPRVKSFQAGTLNSFSISNDTLQPVIDYASINIFLGLVKKKNPISPFPYLHWVIRKVFENMNWRVESDVLSDPEFRNICLLHTGSITDVEDDTVTWNMKNHVPRVKITTFLIGLANRFGWWYDFNYKKKVCTIKPRKSILQNRQKKDITKIVGATYSGKISSSEKRYGLMQSGGTEKPDFSKLKYQGAVNNYDALPDADQSRLDHLYFVRGENSYYICVDQDPISWIKSTDNNWDYIPEGKTDEIPVACLAAGMTELQQMKNTTYDNINRWYVMPNINLGPDNTESDYFYICYHFGLESSINRSNGNNHQFPMASTGCHNLLGALKFSKSLTFEYPEDRGLYKNAWEYYLSLLSQREEITLPISFDMLDIINFDYTKSVVIRNTEYFIKNPHFSLPLRDFCNVELVRM